MTLQVAAGALTTIASGHEDAAATIDDLAASMPTGVDGGIATSHLLAILGTVAGTAGDIADLNRMTAQQVSSVATDLSLTEAEVGAAFTELGSIVTR